MFRVEKMESNSDYLENSRIPPSPLKETTTASLSLTPKGRILYDRNPLTPIVASTFDSKSGGVLLSDGVFSRKQPASESSLASGPRICPPPSCFNSTTRPNSFVDLKSKIDKKKTLSWQEELLLMRNTAQLDETTPVYNISNHMILQLFELKEAQRLSMASDFKKKIEDFEEASRQRADEECRRKKLELEERLVPKTDSGVDVEQTIQRLQDEARIRRMQREDQIEKKLRDLQHVQEQERQEDQRKRMLQAQASKRKEACLEKASLSEKSLRESVTICLEKESLVGACQEKIRRIKESKLQLDSALKEVNDDDDDPLASAVRCESKTKQFQDLVSSLVQDICEHNEAVRQKQAAAAVKLSEQVQQREEEEAPPVDVHQEDLVLYNQVLLELRQCEERAAVFANNQEMKALRFEFQKAAVQPLNEISDVSAQHLQDKLDRLRNLLRGNPVDVGSRAMKPTHYPGGLEFCTVRLAEKLVEQGETQVNVNPKAAFPIAAVIVELWAEFPAFGRLILANFYKRCPYLVPFYMTQREGQSSEDYYKSLGYKHGAGKVEQQSCYLKRTRGVIRLYAAIIMTLPRGTNRPHPHGLEQGWRYLAAVLNLPPLHGITAQVLAEFLTVTGHALGKQYARQFQKMLYLLCTEYLALIRGATYEEAGAGSATRLKDFLNESITKGGIPPPDGQLRHGFW